MVRARMLWLVWLAGCGMRAPQPIDVHALIAQQGPVEARQTLEMRAIADRRDIAVRLALAALDEQQQRPSAAIDVLEQVVALGGPVGVRWHADDQARLARLIAARGRARLARGAASAVADLQRARQLGAIVADAELVRARIAGALVALRHTDGETRDDGRSVLAELAPAPIAGVSDDDRAAWQGARAGATAAQRGRFGAWLWEQGARRAAWDELAAWRAQRPPAEPALDDAYARAARWWTPVDQAGPAGPLTGAARCAFAGCVPDEVVGENLLERAYLIAPRAPRVTDPLAAAAVVAITLHQALRGEVSWGPALAARVDLHSFAEPAQLARLPRHVQPILARLAGLDIPAVPPPPDGATPDQRLVLAAERVLAGASAADIEPVIGNAPYADELRRVASPRAPFAGVARVEAAVRAVGLTMPQVLRPEAIRAITGAYARDPAIADRLVRDAVAAAPDAAIVHAAAGALFDALGDPSRARTAWQAAVDASPEPAFHRGLAEAIARHGDGDAALIAATTAAAGSGDPGVVWLGVARALAGAGRPVHALDAASSALDLATPETVEAAYDVAIDASRALDRDAQVAQLITQRARFAQTAWPDRESPTDRDPTDARAALDAYHQQPTSATIARLWVAARWNPRAVELRAALLNATAPDDPRHAVVVGELVELAGDRDASVRRAAVAALR